MLNAQNLCVSFDDKNIINNVSFHLKQGQIACLLGHSGCGKTTILRAIMGFCPLQNGKIALGDKVIFDEKTNIAAHKRKIGMVFQDYALFPHLNVTQNIGFGLFDLDATAKQQRINQMLELIGLGTHKNHYPHELSGGQQQRVALARALAPKPDLILLDEPFSNLDVDLRTSLSKDIKNLLKSTGVTAILVTHDQGEAFIMADMVGVIEDGKLQQWDSPSQLYHKPSTQNIAKFIGDGTLIDGTALAERSNAMQTGFGVVTVQEEAELTDNKKILIRPEAVTLTQGSPNACVQDKVFQGGYWAYQLRDLADKDTLICHHQRDDLVVGDQVCVTITQGFLV